MKFSFEVHNQLLHCYFYSPLPQIIISKLFSKSFTWFPSKIVELLQVLTLIEKKAVKLIRQWHLQNSVLPPWIPQHLECLQSWLERSKTLFTRFTVSVRFSCLWLWSRIFKNSFDVWPLLNGRSEEISAKSCLVPILFCITLLSSTSSWWMFFLMWQKKKTEQLCYIQNYIVWNMCFIRLVLNDCSLSMGRKW